MFDRYHKIKTKEGPVPYAPVCSRTRTAEKKIDKLERLQTSILEEVEEMCQDGTRPGNSTESGIKELVQSVVVPPESPDDSEYFYFTILL